MPSMCACVCACIVTAQRKIITNFYLPFFYRCGVGEIRTAPCVNGENVILCELIQFNRFAFLSFTPSTSDFFLLCSWIFPFCCTFVFISIRVSLMLFTFYWMEFSIEIITQRDNNNIIFSFTVFSSREPKCLFIFCVWCSFTFSSHMRRRHCSVYVSIL